jgi:hypothetical protein
VNNIEQVIEQARAKGGKITKDVWTEEDAHGSVKMACIQTVREDALRDADRTSFDVVW